MQQEQQSNNESADKSQADDLGTLLFEAFVRVTDPDTQEVILETRA